MTQVNLAQQAWEAGNLERAKALLVAQRPAPGQEELRGFEWRYLWRLCQGDARFTFRGHTESVNLVRFTADGKTVLSRSDDGTIRLWDVSRRRLAATLAFPREARSWAFSADGKTMALGRRDGMIRLWDVATRREIGSFQAHRGQVDVLPHFLARPKGPGLNR